VLLRRGYLLESITLGWNVVGVVVLAVAAVRARSVALGRFGLDSLIEIGASTVLIWQLSGTGEDRQRRALRLIGYAFVLLAAYLAVQSLTVLAAGIIAHPSALGIAWTGITALVMFRHSGDSGSQAGGRDAPAALSHSVVRRRQAEPKTPPASPPSGILPRTMNRIVSFIRLAAGPGTAAAGS
jgi:hypothetical protein